MKDYIINNNIVIEPQRELPVLDTTDVVIAGGGVAGFGAAIGSARLGVKTILVENLGFLGGVATAQMMQAINTGKYIDGAMVELIDRMHKKNGSISWDEKDRYAHAVGGFMNETINFDIECFKETALEMCLEAGVQLLFYTRVCAPIVEGNTIKGIVIENKGGRQAILAKRVVDCTGDGDLLYQLGVPYITGRDSDNHMRPLTVMFRVGGLDVPRMLEYLEAKPDEWQPHFRIDYKHKAGDDTVITRVSGFYDLVEEAKKNGDLYDWIHYLRFEAVYVEKGIALCNTSRVYYLDGTNNQDLVKGEILGRQQMAKIISFIKKYVPGGENAYILDVAPVIGVRETRRFIGEYFFTNEDLYSSKHFDDTIITAVRRMPVESIKDQIDVHPTEPVEGAKNDWNERDQTTPLMEVREFYLNYRMLLPQGIENMLYAGRTMSTTHLVEAFIRSMAWCERFGQVAGAAAALSVKENVSPKQLEFAKLKEALISQGYTRF